MRGILILAGLALFSTAAAADTFTNGYVRRDGAYVQPHWSSDRNNNPFDNYSTRGNTNPYTGQAGTHNPYATPSAPTNPYGSTYGGQRQNCYGLNCR